VYPGVVTPRVATRTRSRSLVAVLLALVLTAPAEAANSDSPGALKQQETTQQQSPTTPAATPGPAPQATLPATATPKAPQTKTHTAGQPSAPVNKGTTKKSTSAPSSAGAAPATTSTRSARRTSARRAAARGASPRRATPRRRSVARGRMHATPVRARGRAGAPGQQVAAGAPGTAPGQAHATTTAVAKAAADRAKPQGQQKSDDPAPLTSISQAADHVVEVIPGTIVLALAGLTALVLLLILRSLAVERLRAKALVTSYGVTVEALATAIEAKDHTTGGHIERVRRLGLLLAAQFVPRHTRDPQMAYGFLLHDIGKLAVPDAILRAPGRLSDDEWLLMRRHPEEGVAMLSEVPFLDRALDVVRHHHERWDGGGYPDGLKGEAIPLWARIFSVVDALDAMTAERPYRQPRSYRSALAEIRRHSGTQFDPAVVAALEGLDPAVVEALLEPAQQVKPLAELPGVEPLVAA
jgi:HD-GYP domain-containing protein (c-di-GMP phosphodiesterase class II)